MVKCEMNQSSLRRIDIAKLLFHLSEELLFLAPFARVTWPFGRLIFLSFYFLFNFLDCEVFLVGLRLCFHSVGPTNAHITWYPYIKRQTNKYEQKWNIMISLNLATILKLIFLPNRLLPVHKMISLFNFDSMLVHSFNTIFAHFMPLIHYILT